MEIVLIFSSIFFSLKPSAFAESGGLAYRSSLSLQQASRERHQLCQQIEKNSDCVKPTNQIERNLVAATGMNVAICKAQQKDLKCEAFVKKFPEYQKNLMSCDPKTICKLSNEKFLIPNAGKKCLEFGIEFTKESLTFLKSGLSSGLSCTSNLNCIIDQELSLLMILLFPSQFAQKQVRETMNSTIASIKTDFAKAERISCLDIETQTKFACYIAAKYLSTVTGATAGAKFTAQKFMASMAKLEKSLDSPSSNSVLEVVSTKAPFRKKETANDMMERLDKYDPTTDKQRAEMMALANGTPPKGTKFIDIENTVLKDANTQIGSELATTLTNQHKEMIKYKFDILAEKYKDSIDIKSYSDAKSQRFALIPKNDSWKKNSIPPEVLKDFENSFNDANREFFKKVNSLNLSKPVAEAPWFRAGIADSADEAALNSRLSREIGKSTSSASGFARSSNPAIVSTKNKVFKEVQLRLKEVTSALGDRSPLLKDIDGTLTVDSEVFDLIKKSEGKPKELQKLLKARYPDETIPQKTIEKLTRLSDLTDRVQPTIWQVTRGSNSILEAKNGALLIDISGMGSRNAEQVLLHLSKCASAKDITLCTRAAEIQATKDFRKTTQGIRDMTLRNCKQVGIKCKIEQSGDDIRVIPESGFFPKEFAANNIATINRELGISNFRQAEVLPNINKENLLVLSGDAEQIEKLLRQRIRQSDLAEKSKDITFNVSMRSRRAGEGYVQFDFSLKDGLRLSPAEVARLRAEQQRALSEYNRRASDRKYEIAPATKTEK